MESFKRVKVKTKSEKSFLATLLLMFFLGIFGFHRFYVGKVWTGLMFLFTGGWFGLGVIWDFVMLVFGSFQDKQGDFVLVS